MEYMSQSQIAALIIGIVFSVISVATTILTIKNAEKLNTFAKAISASIIAPFIAFVGWLFLIFSFIEGFRDDETLTLIVAILLSIVIAGMVIIVSKALYNKHQADYEDEKEGEESENESAQEDNTQNAGTKEPLMITGPANVQENAQEEVSVDAKEVESEEIAEEPQVEESDETESDDTSEDEQESETEKADGGRGTGVRSHREHPGSRGHQAGQAHQRPLYRELLREYPPRGGGRHQMRVLQLHAGI